MAKICIFALFASILLQVKAQYCDLESCGNGTHIDCIMETGAWGDACPTQKNMLNLAPVKELIVKRHNENRNKVAGGLASGFEPASRMGAMVWNITLANLCRKNVRQCDMLHDECHNTPEYNFAGQNLAYRKHLKTDLVNNLQVILELIDQWYNDEIAKATMDDFRMYKGENGIANVAQMLRDSATRVGCAAAAMHDDTYRTMLVCCNYDMGNIYGWPTYSEGPSTSKCKTGKHDTYENLCSAEEEYDVNEFWKDT